MNVRRLVLFIFWHLATVGATLCQAAPANDAFADRIVLAGSSVSATGNLAGATLETGEPGNACSTTVSGGSVWWTWTAPASGTVIIALDWKSLPASFYPDWLQVCVGNSLNGLTELDCNRFEAPLGRYVKFTASAGVSYQIRAFGAVPGVFGFQLTLGDAPVVLVPPRDSMLAAFRSAFFFTVAAGLPKPTLQWKFNGTTLPGETNAWLAVHGIQTNHAGLYSVVASNAGGSTEVSATLTVIETNPVPSLRALAAYDPTRLGFALGGETGRWYKIESSSDLNDWRNPPVISYTNVTGPLSVPRFNPAHQFVRASVNLAADLCGAQQKQIRVAMNYCAIEQKRSLTGMTFGDIHPYLAGGVVPGCPDYGFYAMYAGTNDCSWGRYRGHVMVDPP